MKEKLFIIGLKNNQIVEKNSIVLYNNIKIYLGKEDKYE